MNKISNIFDWLKHINQHKTPINSFSTKDWDIFNSYLIHRFLSQNEDFLELVNEVQTLPPQNKKEIYSIYVEYIPKNNKWSKYIKSKIKERNKDLLVHLKDHFEVSVREVKEYLYLLDNEQLVRILSNRGLDKKEIKQLLK
jgi:hypothetical protein